jgi:hypothetical protein
MFRLIGVLLMAVCVVLCGVMASVLAIGPKFLGFSPGEGLGDKNPQHTFLRKGSKVVDPMSQAFIACYRSL